MKPMVHINVITLSSQFVHWNRLNKVNKTILTLCLYLKKKIGGQLFLLILIGHMFIFQCNWLTLFMEKHLSFSIHSQIYLLVFFYIFYCLILGCKSWTRYNWWSYTQDILAIWTEDWISKGKAIVISNAGSCG